MIDDNPVQKVRITDVIKFIYSEKATKFCETSTLDLTVLHMVKSKVEISQNFVAFSEYMNFIRHELKNVGHFYSKFTSAFP